MSSARIMYLAMKKNELKISFTAASCAQKSQTVLILVAYFCTKCRAPVTYPLGQATQS